MIQKLIHNSAIIFLALIFLLFSGLSTKSESDKSRIYRIKFKDTYFDIAYVNLKTEKIELFWKDQDNKRYGSFSQLDKSLKSRKEDLILATNAGIFDPTFTPVGLLVERGTVLHNLNLEDGTGNFFLKPNGIFLIDSDGAKIVESSRYKTLETKITEATQSGPLLVIDNKIHPVFTMNSKNKVIRSGIGVKSRTEVFIVLSEGMVNFYDFATLFKDKLDCSNALYLDGHISKFYIPSQNRFDDGDFAGIIAVTRK